MNNNTVLDKPTITDERIFSRQILMTAVTFFIGHGERMWCIFHRHTTFIHFIHICHMATEISGPPASVTGSQSFSEHVADFLGYLIKKKCEYHIEALYTGSQKLLVHIGFGGNPNHQNYSFCWTLIFQ